MSEIDFSSNTLQRASWVREFANGEAQGKDDPAIGNKVTEAAGLMQQACELVAQAVSLSIEQQGRCLIALNEQDMSETSINEALSKVPYMIGPDVVIDFAAQFAGRLASAYITGVRHGCREGSPSDTARIGCLTADNNTVMQVEANVRATVANVLLPRIGRVSAVLDHGGEELEKDKPHRVMVISPERARDSGPQAEA